MSKKKFKDGLESLFGLPLEENFEQESPLLVNHEEKRNVKSISKRRKKKAAKRSIGKNFTSDLDSLFEDALTEVLEEKVQRKSVAPVKKAKTQRKKLPRRLTGLDALIRRTVESSDMDFDNTPTKKRVTFIFDKEKLQKLKSIAKVEKAYLKDIIGDVVSEYIEKYEKQQGGNVGFAN